MGLDDQFGQLFAVLELLYQVGNQVGLAGSVEGGLYFVLAAFVRIVAQGGVGHGIAFVVCLAL